MMREDIFAAADESGFKCIKSCCNVPLKVCSMDEWRGDICAFVAAILRMDAENRVGQNKHKRYKNE